jgi:hypothetical protein
MDDATALPKKVLQKPPLIDIKLVERAATLGCTYEELAIIAGVASSAFYRHLKTDVELAEAINRGRGEGRTTLRRLQWAKAHAGSDTMLIWLGKQLLDQKDKSAVEVRQIKAITDLTDEELNLLAEQARRAVENAETRH